MVYLHLKACQLSNQTCMAGAQVVAAQDVARGKRQLCTLDFVGPQEQREGRRLAVGVNSTYFHFVHFFRREWTLKRIDPGHCKWSGVFVMRRVAVHSCYDGDF
jgi:hypothetical protein